MLWSYTAALAALDFADFRQPRVDASKLDAVAIDVLCEARSRHLGVNLRRR
jgi:hypothetical protein